MIVRTITPVERMLAIRSARAQTLNAEQCDSAAHHRSGSSLARAEVLPGDLPVPRLFDANESSRGQSPAVEKSIGTTRPASIESIAALSTGRDSRKPCARWHPKSSSALAALTVSTRTAHVRLAAT